MQVLVTGGAGYIGSVVNQALMRSGHAVIVYDDLRNGHADAVPPGTPLVRADLTDREALTSALRKYEIQAVVHMAADCLVGESMADPGKYYRNNLTAGVSLLECDGSVGRRRSTRRWRDLRRRRLCLCGLPRHEASKDHLLGIRRW